MALRSPGKLGYSKGNGVIVSGRVYLLKHPLKVSIFTVSLAVSGALSYAILFILTGEEDPSRKITSIVTLVACIVGLLSFRQKIANDNRSEWWKRFEWCLEEERRISELEDKAVGTEYQILSEVQHSLLEEGRGKMWTGSERKLLRPLMDKSLLLQMHWMLQQGASEDDVYNLLRGAMPQELAASYFSQIHRS
ncbi:hypothetical protein [uncultured Corynebacterium sp.]|nr:hypothetical protein [uncultured Corynebacterium sp.]